MALTPATGLADYASGISTAALQVNSDTGQVSIGTDSPTTARLRVGTAITMSVGVITATDAVFRGNVSIAGTLTYEDVTSIDSVGILTARAGVRIPAGGLTVAGVSSFSSALDVNSELDVDGQTDLDNLIVAGVSTFSSSIDLNGELDVDGQTDLDTLQVAGVSTFAADVSIADKIIHAGDTNTAIRFPAADAFTVETSGNEQFRIGSDGLLTGKGAQFNSNITPTSGNGVEIFASTSTLGFIQAFDRTNGAQGNLTIKANSISLVGGSSEVIGISSDATASFAGNVKIGTTNNVTFGSRRVLAVANGTTGGVLALYNNTTATANPRISSNPGGSEINDIGIHAASTNGSIIAYTNNDTERLRITSAGKVLVGFTTVRSNFYNTSTIIPKLQIEGTDYSSSALSITTNGAGNSRNPYSILLLSRSRGTDFASNTVVADDDVLGAVDFQGNDGTQFVSAAAIEAIVNGTPGADDMPGALTFLTTPDGGSTPTEKVRIDSTGRLLVGRTSTTHEHPLQVQAASGANAVAIAGRSADDQSEITFYENDNTTVLAQIQQVSGYSVFRHRTGYLRFDSGGVNEKMRLDSSGRLLINTTTSRIVEDHAGNGPQGKIQIEGTNSDGMLSIISAGTADANRCGTISLGRHRNNTIGGTPTVVNAGDALGAICFAGGDGTDMRTKGAKIICEVDGTPGSNDMPGRLMFFTTPDGDASPDERLRITKDGHVSIVADNKKLLVGAGDDVQIYHDGTNSYVESITGDLNIQATATNADDIVITAKDDVYVRGEGDLFFSTGASFNDVMKVHTAGVITMGAAHSPASGADLTIRAAAPQLSLYATPGNNVSRITLGDTDDHDIGQLGYDNSDNSMFFSTLGNTVLAIDNAGAQVQRQRYYTQVNASNIGGSATRTLTITGLRYGVATIHFGGTDGNGQYVHFKINLGGQMWGSGNGYNAEVESTGYAGGSYSVTKNNTSYVISVTAGSNTMYYSYTFESTSYTTGAYAVIAES